VRFAFLKMNKLTSGLKSVGRVVLVYSLSCFYTTIIVLKTLFKVIINGTSYLSVKPRPTPPACLNDPAFGTHQYAKLKEVKLHYVEAGDHSKPLVIFLHGFPEFWYSWRHQLKALKNDFWTVAVDMRGYGDSDKPSGVKAYHSSKIVGDIEQLIEALGRTSCILVAHDWGGLIAWYLTIKSPQMVDKLIILNSPHPSAFMKLIRSSVKQFFRSWYIFYFQFPFIPEYLANAHDVSLIDKAFLESNPKGKKVFCLHDIEAFKYAYARRADFTGPINYYRNLRSTLLANAVDLPKIKVPVLIIWGTEDHALGVELATTSSQHCENCTVKFVKGASHWIQQDSHAVVNQYINQFLEGKSN